MKLELAERIGSGGMGEVFRTTDGRAVKRVLPHLSRDRRFLDLFLAEVKVTAQLQHPNIVSISELVEENGAWLLVMEYVHGVDLHHVARLPPGLVAQVGLQAAAALDYAHKARDRQGRALKVVHRDVSPHNVLVSTSGVVKLIDFGVARALEGVPGKPAYVAPEVADGAPASPKSDQFSLGVVLWELLTGERLFKGATDAVIVQRAAECVVPDPEVAPALDAVVLRALAKDPAQRYPDCAALKVALEDVLLELEGPHTPEELARTLSG
ncbi:MAG: serine/threonine protein kinase [Archangiaceae bacterium]|nr:serine/threonine protein kinase [Archangiaceae bacterium]